MQPYLDKPVSPAHRQLLRLLGGMRQADIARLSGVSYQHINDVLHFRRRINRELLAFLGFERVTIERKIRR